METTRPTVNPPAARFWDMDMFLVVVVAGLMLMVVSVATQRYNPTPLDAEAGWFLSP
jgi:hypothetical protein